MGAATEMSRLDSLPTEQLNKLLNMEGVPSVTSSSNGKVLTVVSGEWKAETPANELPAVTASDNGDVLTVVNGEWDKAAPSGGLPSVTSDDNGDVLTVVDGEWDKAAPGGGGGGFVITFETADYSTFTADKTFAELKAAIDGGESVFAYLRIESDPQNISYAVFGLYDASTNQGDASYASFQEMLVFPDNPPSLYIQILSLMSDNSVSYSSQTYTLPAT